MMTSLVNLTLSDAKIGLSRGDFTSVELTEAHLRAMEEKRFLNAFITETPELAITQAQESDTRRRSGQTGAMEGLPIALKDIFCTEGVLTTAASHILDGFCPPYESTVSARLRAAGAVTLGKTNMDEFAMGSSNMTSYYGSVLNPWQCQGTQDTQEMKLVPGGSSGGSAAAVAARLCLAALGTDTGGSIRQPASFCGIVGFKPTYGRCSRWGMIAFASSLDQAGPMTRTVRDSALMLCAMSGHDWKDSTSAHVAVPNFESALTGDIRGLKVGIPCEYRPDGLSPEIVALWEKGIDWLKAAGAEPMEINLPHTQYALATYYILAPAEASSNLARYDGVRFGLRQTGNNNSLDDMYVQTRTAGFGREVQRRVLLGTYVLSAGYYDAYYLKAQKMRTLIIRDFQQAFETVDVILTPTAPTPAFSMGEKMDDPITMYLNDIFTVPASLAGLPGLSVPAGLSPEGLPLGLQIIGQPFDEQTVLNVGGVLETAACFTQSPPLTVGET